MGSVSNMSTGAFVIFAMLGVICFIGVINTFGLGFIMFVFRGYSKDTTQAFKKITDNQDEIAKKLCGRGQ